MPVSKSEVHGITQICNSFRRVSMDYSFRSNAGPFREGMRDGAPIGAGYFAVSFALGIAASRAGLTPLQGFLASLLCNASAGEYAAFGSIAARAPLIEVAFVLIIVNARYVLMSSAMAQRLDPEIPLIHRLVGCNPSNGSTDDKTHTTARRSPRWSRDLFLYG